MTSSERDWGRGKAVRVIERGAGARAVFLAEPAREGDVVLCVYGVVQATRGRHTLQLNAREHLRAATADPAPAWIFLNHSCAPSAYFHERELVALRDLAAGEELTFNYNATEYELAEPFACHCQTCPPGHVVRGYKHLLAAPREALGDHVMAYLSALK